MGGRGLSIRQECYDAAPFQVADDAGVSVIAPPGPIVNAGDPRRVNQGTATAPDHTQERVFAHRQHQPFCKACCRSTAKREIAGALSCVVEITVGYAQERVQFGKPIAKFQAIQHNLAILAAHSAAANAAADMAAEAAERDMNRLVIAAAKTRCGEAASAGAAIAHAAHGAIGFTQEHVLHHFTKRLWSWRDEFGKESDWALELGRAAAKAGPQRLWSDIVTA